MYIYRIKNSNNTPYTPCIINSIKSLLTSINKHIFLFSFLTIVSYNTQAENTFFYSQSTIYKKNSYPPTYRRSIYQSSFFQKNSTPPPKIRKRPPESISRKRQRNKPLFIALNDLGISLRKNIQKKRTSNKKTSFYNRTYPLKKTHQTASVGERQQRKNNNKYSSRSNKIHAITQTSVAVILAPLAIPYLLLEKAFSHKKTSGEISVKKTKPVSISRKRTKSQPLLISLFTLKKKKNTASLHRNKNKSTEVSVYKKKMRYRTTTYSHQKQYYKNTQSQSHKVKSIFLTSSSIILAPIFIPYILIKKMFEKKHHVSHEKSYKKTEPVSISRKRTKAPPIFVSFNSWKQKTTHDISRSFIKTKRISPLNDRNYSSQNTKKHSKSKSILFYSGAVIISPLVAPYFFVKQLYNRNISFSKQKTFTKNEQQSSFYRELSDVKWSFKSWWKGVIGKVKHIRTSPYDRRESSIWYK